MLVALFGIVVIVTLPLVRIIQFLKICRLTLYASETISAILLQ